MDFRQSQTMMNLARSFAGESQARMRYTIYAKQARQQQQEYLARIFDQTADNERAHAQEFLEKLRNFSGEPILNLEIDGGFPYPLGSTEQNLHFAARGEREEHQTVYPAFAAVAREEGYPELAQLWTDVAVVEGLHSNVFQEAHRQVTDGSLYQKSEAVLWRCENCGHIASGLQPWKVCPICGKPIGWVQGHIDQLAAPATAQG